MKSSVLSGSPSATAPLDMEGAPRHQQVRQAIMEAIRAGEFAPGERLPSERDLALRFEVSHMTARRAVTEMVADDLLERQPKRGTYVRSHGSRRLATVTVNLIYPFNPSSFGEQFLQCSLSGLKKRGWHHHLIPLQSGREHAALRALESGEPTLLMPPMDGLDARLSAALCAAGGHAVLIGNRLADSEVPSIMADDAQAIRLLMGHLQGAGHRKIGIVSKRPRHTIDQCQIATWKACCAYATPDEIESRLIFAEIEDDVPEAISTRNAVRDYLRSPDADATALICLSDTSTLATMAACRDVGRPVPEKMAVVAACNTTLLELFNPPVTCADVHLERHIELALQWIEESLEGRAVADGNGLIAPSLIIRESVAPPFASLE